MTDETTYKSRFLEIVDQNIVKSLRKLTRKVKKLSQKNLAGLCTIITMAFVVVSWYTNVLYKTYFCAKLMGYDIDFRHVYMGDSLLKNLGIFFLMLGLCIAMSAIYFAIMNLTKYLITYVVRMATFYVVETLLVLFTFFWFIYRNPFATIVSIINEKKVEVIVELVTLGFIMSVLLNIYATMKKLAWKRLQKKEELDQ